MDLLKDVKSCIDPQQDFLGQGVALQILERAINEMKPPACLALYGSWDAGKTALMHSAYQNLKSSSDHQAVWFDPRAYERHQNVLQMLVHDSSRVWLG